MSAHKCLGQTWGGVVLLFGVLVFVGLGQGGRLPVANAQSRHASRGPEVPSVLAVDAERGSDRSRGTRETPMKTLSAALARLPDPLNSSVTIELRGEHETTGGRDMAANCLELVRRMRPGVTVKIVGVPDDNDKLPILGWEGGRAIVDCRAGEWWIENVTIGSFSKKQRCGVLVAGPGYVTLKNVRISMRSFSGGGIHVQRGGQVALRGAIRLNDDLYEKAPDESFCGIVAEDHGVVRFRERDGASLELGNGSLSASYYGVIRLGCETARINCWNEQSNTLAINNGGRIDLHGTDVHLRARHKRNTPIGLEHDGHILGEDAHVVIEGENNMAIALQKASTFTCNDIELRGKFGYCLWASSGSMFVGRFLTDVGCVEATTGATISIEKIDGRLLGPVVAKHAARISLPDRDVLPE